MQSDPFAFCACALFNYEHLYSFIKARILLFPIKLSSRMGSHLFTCNLIRNIKKNIEENSINASTYRRKRTFQTKLRKIVYIYCCIILVLHIIMSGKREKKMDILEMVLNL